MNLNLVSDRETTLSVSLTQSPATGSENNDMVIIGASVGVCVTVISSVVLIFLFIAWRTKKHVSLVTVNCHYLAADKYFLTKSKFHHMSVFQPKGSMTSP